MLIKAFRDIWPNFDLSARVAENVIILGDVTMKENSSLWFGVIARGDVSPIIIGANSNIQDGCLLHGRIGIPTVIGKNVTAGHGAILHGCTIGDNCLIGMGAILLNGCIIGEGSIVAAGALIPERSVIPPGSVVMGSPGKVIRAVQPDEFAHILVNAKEYILFAEEQLCKPFLRK